MASKEAGSILDGLKSDSWRVVAWRRGTRGTLRKLCARVRVHRVGLGGTHLPSSGWLIGERSVDGQPGETKYYFVGGMDRVSLDDIVELAHSHWIIERFYQDAKGEVGLDDYEGRLWSGFHRHVALCMLAHCYLALHQNYGPAIAQHVLSGLGSDSARTEVLGPTRGFPPQKERRSLASVRRLVVERLFLQVIEHHMRTRDHPP